MQAPNEVDPSISFDRDTNDIPSSCPVCREAARQFDEQTGSSVAESGFDPTVRVSLDLGPALEFEDRRDCTTCRTIWSLLDGKSCPRVRLVSPSNDATAR